MISPHSIDELIWHMPGVAREAQNEWVRGFAISILRFSKRKAWEPSVKQEALMRRLVAERSTHQDDFEVIEDE